ncbi:MAG: Membrane-bound lytic murein transglycosylase B precursor (EC [uncultured Sulfurovum sp.]|uniref:Membrane-bound lytic murein transglycosylase B (EC) n=1 Tax=uncultured Sulfurovum sp. TaxID=269237 RepID=A0A6S6TLN0_9BACT|nr:MAG: Membrane-bound lytic murein transglycosylase B precursor (EC [uncultured Sulfurovum sp.]
MKTIFKLLFYIFLSTSTLIGGTDYTKKPSVKRFIKSMQTKYNYKSSTLYQLFKDIKPKGEKEPYIPKKPDKEFMKLGSWDRYERIMLHDKRVSLGVQFLDDYKTTLARAKDIYGIPSEYIAAIIGIESYYGKNRGKFYVFDRLAYLAFNGHRRWKFYRYELQEFLRMTARQNVNPKAVLGSSSGAIGLGQFMPSNYKSFVVDFNNDGRKQMNSFVDAIGSISNYLSMNGWRKGEPVATRVRYPGNRYNQKPTGYKHRYKRVNLYGIKPVVPFDYKKKVSLIKLKRTRYDELWYGAKNFRVITTYNHSSYYAMAVHQLAQKIKDKKNSLQENLNVAQLFSKIE